MRRTVQKQTADASCDCKRQRGPFEFRPGTSAPLSSGTYPLDVSDEEVSALQAHRAKRVGSRLDRRDDLGDRSTAGSWDLNLSVDDARSAKAELKQHYQLAQSRRIDLASRTQPQRSRLISRPYSFGMMTKIKERLTIFCSSDCARTWYESSSPTVSATNR